MDSHPPYPADPVLAAQLEALVKERDYYRRHADELAAQCVKQDFTISSLQLGLKQKKLGLALLSELHLAIDARQSLPEILCEVVHAIAGRLGMTRVVAMTPGPEADSYIPVQWTGYKKDARLEDLLVHPKKYWLDAQESLLVNGASPSGSCAQYILETFQLPFFVLTPVVVSGSVAAILLAGREVEQNPFSPRLNEADVDTMRAIAVLVSTLLHRLHLTALQDDNAALRRMAVIDQLTGIPNRRHFEETLDLEWKRSLRKGGPLSVFFLDVDHFKKWNDTLGHAAGDIVLEQVARIMTQSLRPSDLGARYGGEEFAVLLPDTDTQGAEAVAERVRRSIECSALGTLETAVSPLVHERAAATPQRGVTVSIGVATATPTEGLTTAELLQRADQALYGAKYAGRNRVLVSGTS